MGIGLIAGLLVGLIAAGLSQGGHPGLANIVGSVRPIGSLFLNLLSMVVIPLVATALFAGIAKLGDLRTVGRLVVRTLAFFWRPRCSASCSLPGRDGGAATRRRHAGGTGGAPRR